MGARASGLDHEDDSRAHGTQARLARLRGDRGEVGQALSFRLSSAAQKIGRRTQHCLDHQVASACSRL